MNKRIKDAFDQVHADEELKNRTMEFLAQQTAGFGQYSRPKKILSYRNMVAAAASLVLILLGTGGYRLYFIPTTSIDIEINPSVTLGINRFDKVVTMESHNEDGSVLLDSVNVKYADYTDAINEIITDESIAGYLAQDEIMEISVTSSDDKKSQEILSGVESCTNQHKNIQCYGGNSEMAAAAREAGLSLGKYQAYLELQKQTPDITAEDLQGKTMREIRDMMEHEESGEAAGESGKHQGNGNGNGNSHSNGAGQGNGNSNGNGQGKGSGNGNGGGNGGGKGNGRGNARGNARGKGNGSGNAGGKGNGNAGGNGAGQRKGNGNADGSGLHIGSHKGSNGGNGGNNGHKGGENK